MRGRRAVDDAKADVSRILRREAPHALEERRVQQHRVHCFLAHHCTSTKKSLKLATDEEGIAHQDAHRRHLLAAR